MFGWFRRKETDPYGPEERQAFCDEHGIRMTTQDELLGPFAELRAWVSGMPENGTLAEFDNVYRTAIERGDVLPTGRLLSTSLIQWVTGDGAPAELNEMPRYLEPFKRRFEEAPSPVTGALYAQALTYLAGVARGQAWAHETSDEQWAGFHGALAHATEVLAAANPDGVDDYAWLHTTTEVVKLSNGSPRERIELFERAWSMNYANIKLFGDFMTMLLPRWSGKGPAIGDKFARRVLAETRAEYGCGGYTMAYSYWASYPQVDAEETELDIDLLRQGCMDMLERFPDSVMIHNELARTMSWLDQEDLVRLIFDRGLRRVEEYSWSQTGEENALEYAVRAFMFAHDAS